MGAGVALDVAARSSVAGAVLVSPATGWDRTALGGARERLIRLPDPVLAVIIALSSYQLLDRGQLDTTLRRIATGETSPLLEGEDREAYAWRVVGELPQRLALPASACRHRMREAPLRPQARRRVWGGVRRPVPHRSHTDAPFPELTRRPPPPLRQPSVSLCHVWMAR